ncbi:unnamed protein product [Hydatigera taeniaeformis]|uniref:Uncharacterized protein n=1 Tax=Hydatigena taeniaeformis TaxID=6205 RepID=A0A158REG2_HYDTA|nr:unnamed protein product [Hydatigera taeniaeformis]
MTPRELAFPGHLTPPDIQAYQQFSNQSGNPLFSSNRLRSFRKPMPLLLDGVDGRLNPESFYIKSKSASKRRRDLQVQEILPVGRFFEMPALSPFETEVGCKIKPVLRMIQDCRLDDQRVCESLTINDLKPRRPNSIHQAVESYMRSCSLKSYSVVNKQAKEESTSETLMPEPSLHTWRMASEIVELILSGQVSWKHIEPKFKCREPEKHEVELFCRLSPQQKRHKNVFLENVDRWGVRRNIDGPFWPFGLGPLGPPPNLRDGFELWNMERPRQIFPYDDDECVFAHCYPYTYTDLKTDIRDMMQKARKLQSGSVKCEKLCSTLAGNTCFLITITDPGRGDVCFSAVRHSRCSLVGRDVNRTYTIYGPDRIPEVHFTRKLVEQCQDTYKDVIFCDFHGHSQAFNAFMYGTDSGYRSVSVGGLIEPPKTYLTNPKQYLVDRMIPFLISKQDPRRFSFRSCRFSLQPWREGCARITLWRKFNLTHCFTMETSLFGTNLEPGSSLRYFDRGDLQTLGRSVALGLLEFHKICSDDNKFTETLIEMGKAMLQEIMLNQILSTKAKNSLKTSNTGQLELNKDFETNIGSVDDFANAFNKYGDFLVEDDEVDSSSVSDASSISASEFIVAKPQNMAVRGNSAPVGKCKRRRRKHRKCRRRRKNRRRRLALLRAALGNQPKVGAIILAPVLLVLNKNK